MRGITVTKIVEFEAAHFLPHYEGKCKNLHGHTYKLEVEAKRVEENVLEYEGMVMDFGVLKEYIEAFVLNKFDHALLNDVMDIPTAEMTVRWIATELNTSARLYAKGIRVVRVRVWETSNSYAEWRDE